MAAATVHQALLLCTAKFHHFAILALFDAEEWPAYLEIGVLGAFMSITGEHTEILVRLLNLD